MPLSASSKAPWRDLTASVNAPFSWPKSSLSIRFGATAPQSNTTKGAGRSPAAAVDGPGREFLACAGLALDEHGDIDRGHSLQDAEDFPHGPRGADQVAEAVRGTAEILDAFLQG